MQRTVKVILLALSFLLAAGSPGCGDHRRVVKHECISFTLDPGYGYAFFDPNPDEQPSDFPLGNQLRVVAWDRNLPDKWLIFIYFPIPSGVPDLLKEADKRVVDGVEVLSSEIEGFYLQAYLDPRMGVGISCIKDEASLREAQSIVESLKVKKALQD